MPLKLHRFKTWPSFFDDLASGLKPTETRDISDRDLEPGDGVLLEEWDPAARLHTGKFLFTQINRIWRTPGTTMATFSFRFPPRLWRWDPQGHTLFVRDGWRSQCEPPFGWPT